MPIDIKANQNHYEIIGVSRSASLQEITIAFRKKAMIYHPDKNPGENEIACKEIMAKLTNAYDILKDPITRKEYDDKLNNPKEKHELFDESTLGDISVYFKSGYSKPDISECLNKLTRMLDGAKIQTTSKYFSGSEFIKYNPEDFYNYKGNTVNDIYSLIKLKERDLKAEIELEPDIDFTRPPDVKSCWTILCSFLHANLYGRNLNAVKNYLLTSILEIEDKGVSNSEYTLLKAIRTVVSLDSMLGNESVLFEAVSVISDYLITCSSTNVSSFRLLANKDYRVFITQVTNYYLRNNYLINSVIANLIDKSDKELINSLKKDVCDTLSRSGTVTEHQRHCIEAVELIIRLNNSLRIIFDKNPNGYLEAAFQLIDFLPCIDKYTSKTVKANTLLKIAAYFLKVRYFQRSVEKKSQLEQLAFGIIIEAFNIVRAISPDKEMSILFSGLCLLSKFEFCTPETGKVIEDLNKRLVFLQNIYPVVGSFKSNVNVFLSEYHKLNTLALFRNYLNYVYPNIKNSNNEKNLLYQIYEACIRNWFVLEGQPKIESEVRLQLLDLLLSEKGWSRGKIHDLFTSPWPLSIEDKESWFLSRNVKVNSLAEKNCISSLDSLIVDLSNGDISFLTRAALTSSRKPRLSPQGIVEAFYAGLSYATLSLDSADPFMPCHPCNQVTIIPNSLMGTELFRIMLRADYLLKAFVIGQEVCRNDNFSTKDINDLILQLPPHLKVIIDNFHKSKSDKITRFWLEAEPAEIIYPDLRSQESPTATNVLPICVADVDMVLKKREMFRDTEGNLKDKTEADEGWFIYILNSQQISDLKNGKFKIKSPAIINLDKTDYIYFYEGEVGLSEQFDLGYNEGRLNELRGFARDENNCLLVADQKSVVLYRIYSITKYITKRFEKPHNFSSAYIFTREFTANYSSFSHYFPEFAILKEYCKLTLFVRVVENLINNINETLKSISTDENFNRALSDIYRGDIKPGSELYAQVTARIQFKYRLESILKILSTIKPVNKEVDISKTCLWVPTNFNRNRKDGSVFFKYGGVNAAPRPMPLTPNTREYNDLYARTTSSGSHNCIGSDTINRLYTEVANIHTRGIHINGQTAAGCARPPNITRTDVHAGPSNPFSTNGRNGSSGGSYGSGGNNPPSGGNSSGGGSYGSGGNNPPSGGNSSGGGNSGSGGHKPPGGDKPPSFNTNESGSSSNNNDSNRKQYQSGEVLPGTDGLKAHSMTNEQTRQWYHQKLDNLYKEVKDKDLNSMRIEDLRELAIDFTKSRCEYKATARHLMQDQVAANNLPPIQAARQIVGKIYGEGYRGKELYVELINRALKSNPSVDSKFNLKRDYEKKKP